MKLKPTIIYKDDDIIVVNKPPHYLSIPDRFDAEKDNLKTWIERQFQEVFVVHRIDKETSGLICFARNKEAHQNISAQFENRSVKKLYWVLVEGTPQPKEGAIDQPIAASLSQLGKMVIAPKGKPSLTHYRVLEEFARYSLVEADLKTGRTHQIRVHFEAINHPLLVDKMYGRKAEFLLSQIKTKRLNLKKGTEERPLMSRSTLHARSLSFRHPSSGELISFEADLPKDFNAVLKQLRKWGS